MPPDSASFPTVTRSTTVSAQRVWQALSDGWTYSQWVVGNSRMRAVDHTWPAVGSKIHHSIGLWPLVVNDVTVVEECQPPQQLVLLAKTRPWGKARITLRLFDTESGCRIEMDEVPVGVPAGWIPDRLALLMAYPRNRETLWRLTSLVERKTTSFVHQNRRTR